MTPFRAPTDEILFSLRHVAGARTLPDWDDDLAEDILHHFAEFAEGVIAPLNQSGDTEGCSLVKGRVHLPDGFKSAFQQLAEAGWQGLTAPLDHGGMAAHPLVAAGVSEIFSGANIAMQMLCNLGPGAISTLRRFGTPAQQSTWIPRLVSGQALSTMCLTEAQAGSDLSAIRTRAVPCENGWQITGDKIFISGGDQDMSDGILHLVLARTGPDDAGIKGLSLFLCPSDINGGRNTVSVTRIEDKLGLHASPTCQMRFDSAHAELVGEEGAGLTAMFTLMNHARLDVALQGTAHAARAAQIAAAWAADRHQGRRLDGTPATLDCHADVTRMLDRQRSLAIGARGMCHVTGVELAKNARPELVDFLTPVCKIFCSEAGIEAADTGIQIMGGYGYLTEYGMSQTWRDARITAIYEGANGIHARALATRGLKNPKAPDHFEALIQELSGGSRTLETRLERWRHARSTVEAAADPTALAHEFSKLTGDLFFRAVWSRISTVAHHAPDPDEYRRLVESLTAPNPFSRGLPPL